MDFKTGHRWELVPSHRIDTAGLGLPSDIKVPWELSRCQHLVTLGRAWLTFQDPRYPLEFQSQIRSWIRANPVGRGVNWACTMDVALRAVSWIWALELLRDAPLEEEFWNEVLLSLYRHGLWIPENLEIGAVNGNHYASDALGLLACGVLFRRTSEGESWRRKGLSILEQEIQLQADGQGVDIEASVPYHRLVLEIFLVGSRLAFASGQPVSAAYREKLERMFEFVDAYITPGGLSPQFGDADDGRALILG